MKNFSDRLNQVIALQKKAFFPNLVVSGVLTYVSTSALALESMWFAAIAAVFLMWLFMKIMGMITLSWIQAKVYDGDLDAFVKDAQDAANSVENPQPETKEVIMKIVGVPEKPIGRYMDADIFEWMEVKDPDGVTHRYEFFGTVDLSAGENPPQGTLTFPPGIVFKEAMQVTN